MAERTTVRKAALGPGCYREPDRFARGNLAPPVAVCGGGLRWPRRRMAWGRICSETVFCRFARGFIFSILPSSMTLSEWRSGLDTMPPATASPCRFHCSLCHRFRDIDPARFPLISTTHGQPRDSLLSSPASAVAHRRRDRSRAAAVRHSRASETAAVTPAPKAPRFAAVPRPHVLRT